MIYPLAFDIADLMRFLPVIVILILMILGSLLGNSNKQRQQDQRRPEESDEPQSWEEMLEEMMGGRQRRPPEAPRAEPPPVERPTVRRPPPPPMPSRPAPPRPVPPPAPPIPKRKPQKQQKQRRPQQTPAEIIQTTLPRTPHMETPAIAAASQLPDRPSEAGQTSASRMNLVSSEIGSDQEARTKAAKTAAVDHLRHWLTPSTLRREFILTEILQPPIGLREER